MIEPQTNEQTISKSFQTSWCDVKRTKVHLDVTRRYERLHDVTFNVDSKLDVTFGILSDSSMRNTFFNFAVLVALIKAEYDHVDEEGSEEVDNEPLFESPFPYLFPDLTRVISRLSCVIWWRLKSETLALKLSPETDVCTYFTDSYFASVVPLLSNVRFQ